MSYISYIARAQFVKIQGLNLLNILQRWRNHEEENHDCGLYSVVAHRTDGTRGNGQQQFDKFNKFIKFNGCILARERNVGCYGPGGLLPV